MSADGVQTQYFPNESEDNIILGDYLLEEQLQGGENSSTYRGFNQKTQAHVAIKVFPRSSPMSKDLYEAELKAYKTLHVTPGVLQLIESFENDDYFILITEFIPEGSLRNILKNYPEGIGIQDAIQVFLPIAETIDRIHTKNIIHRDLKPENILCRRRSKSYDVFITDFGVVKFTTTSQNFQTETTAGTSWYLAPEALTGDPKFLQSTAVDIYAFGIMLYEALEGRYPYDDINQVIYQRPPLFPTRTQQAAGEFVARLILKTIDIDPSQRPDTAKEIIQAIQNAIRGNLNEKQRESQKWVGQKINNYKVEEVLGIGKMGTTLRANNIQTNKQVVLKAFARSEQRNEKAYQKEIDSFEKLETGHGVLKPVEIFDFENTSYIVTEYQSGGTLRNLLTKRPRLSTNDMMEVFTQIAEALDYIHEKKIVHRDIKPENVVYSINDEKIVPYITDFGVAAILASTQGSFPTHHIGTFRYMAPELHKDNTRGTKAVDIYAFGIMLYEALEGHAPFESPTKKHKQPPEVLTADKTQKELGTNAKNILLQALAQDAEERPRTATEIMQQIRRQGAHEMFLGKKYGKYTIEKFIGRGTYGATYRAYINKGKKKFAFKILSVPTPLMHEVEKLKKLSDHEAIVPILDSGSENGIHYVVTDYFNGESLRDELQSYRMGMELDEALKLFKPIAKAIDYLHDAGMVHGDIKPENVILCKNRNDPHSFEPVITGFGISRIAGNIQQFLSSNNYNYIAPELWKDGEPSPASDMYAFGTMLYETLEGTPPFNAKSLADKMNQHLNDRPPIPKNLSQVRSKRAINALLQSLDKKPELRPTSAQALINVLEDKTQDGTTSLGRITGPLTKLLGPIINAGNKKLDVSRSQFISYVILFGAVLAVIFRGMGSVYPSIPPTVTPTPTLSKQVPVTETVFTPIPSPVPPTPSPTSLPAAPECNPQEAVPEDGCTLQVRDSVAVGELYKSFYGKTQTRYDEVAIAYYNNRKVMEEPGYDLIDIETFNIEKGSTLFLASPRSIEEFREFPRPVLQSMDPGSTTSKITVSGSSSLYPLSAKITEDFVNTTKDYEIDLKPNTTKQGVSDFCAGRAEIFSSSEGKLRDCLQVAFMKFEVARYAVVIYMNDQNPHKDELEKHPLTNQELLRLLTSARSWKDVREELDPDGESVINRYYPVIDSGAFEIVQNTIFPSIDPNSITNPEFKAEEQSIPDEVMNDIYSIGFSSYIEYQENRDDLVAIPVNNVHPNPDTIGGESPDYPLTRQLYLYTGKDTYYSNSLVRFFINFYLSYELDYLDELGYFAPNKSRFLYNLKGNPIR